jgi:hypothetical protein
MPVLATAEEKFQVCLEALRWLFGKLTDRVAIQKFSIDLLPNRRRSLSQPSTLWRGKGLEAKSEYSIPKRIR